MKKYTDLISQYKHLFATNEMYASRMFGVECGAGWYDIIEQLLKSIDWAIKRNKHPTIQISQIKEKFGGLRFYYDGGDSYIEGLVSFAERMCDLTCEHCGSNQNIGTTSGWIITLCYTCSQDENINRGKKEWKTKEQREKDMKLYYEDLLKKDGTEPKSSE